NPLPPPRTRLKGLAAWPVAARLGEPSKVTRTHQPCQVAENVRDARRDSRGWNGRWVLWNAAVLPGSLSCGPNVQGVSRTVWSTSSQPDVVLLFLALSPHDQRAATRLLPVQPQL